MEIYHGLGGGGRLILTRDVFKVRSSLLGKKHTVQRKLNYTCLLCMPEMALPVPCKLLLNIQFVSEKYHVLVLTS